MRRWLSLSTLFASGFRLSRRHFVVLVAVLFLLVVQRIGFEVLGTGQAGTRFTDAFTILANSLAIGLCLVASRRGRGVARLFWLLFSIAFILEMAGNAGWAYCHYFQVHVRDSALFPSLFYRLP